MNSSSSFVLHWLAWTLRTSTHRSATSPVADRTAIRSAVIELIERMPPEERPDVLDLYQKRFKHILVDEYQDTNYSQYLIVRKLAAARRNICVVGDDAQSIYSFRGARIENILNPL